MNEQEKKRQRIYDWLNVETKSQNVFHDCSFFMASIKPRPVTFLITLYRVFYKTKQIPFPI